MSTADNSQPPNPPIANDAALIATFFYPRDESQPLVAHVKDELQLSTQAANKWHHPATKARMWRFNPVERTGHDTTVVQLALNAHNKSDPAAIAWGKLRDQLKATLNETVLQSIWGYSLTYQAVLTTGHQLDTHTFDAVLPDDDSRLLHLSPSKGRLHPLAVTNMLNGRIWLLDIPLKGRELQVATVYVALNPHSANKQFVAGALYGPSAALLMPELIAHKSYHQTRQYWGVTAEMAYSDKLNHMRTTTVNLLERPQSRQAVNQFEPLSEHSRIVIGGIAKLDALRISLRKQLYNYKRWEKQATEGDILAFHHSQISTIFEELSLKVEEGQTVLQATDTAINIIQTRLNKREETWHQVIGLIFAVLGVALAVPQLIDREIAAALLTWYQGSAPTNGYSLLQLVSVQFAITTVIALLVILLIMAIYARLYARR